MALIGHRRHHYCGEPKTTNQQKNRLGRRRLGVMQIKIVWNIEYTANKITVSNITVNNVAVSNITVNNSSSCLIYFVTLPLAIFLKCLLYLLTFPLTTLLKRLHQNLLSPFP
jgi:hypothetical protein